MWVLNIKILMAIIMFLFFVFTLSVKGNAGVIETKKAKKKSGIIDMHAHIAGIGAGDSGCFISGPMRKSWKYGIYLKSFGVTEKEVLKHGDEIIVARLSQQLAQSEHVKDAVVLAMDGVIDDRGELDPSRTEFYIPNEYVVREVCKYDNLYYGASINPFRPDALERLDRAAKDGAVLIKWLPSIQYIDPADKRHIPFYRRLKELGMPLLTHTGDEHSFSKARNEFADPERLHLPLKQGVTVIAAHAASSGKNKGQDNMDRLLPMFAMYPNLFADISSLTQINKVGSISRLLRQGELHDRLLYGTDMPLIKTGLTSPVFHVFKLSPRELIFTLRIDNPWDQDVMLKRALGMPERVFTRAADLLRIKGMKVRGEIMVPDQNVETNVRSENEYRSYNKQE